MKLSTWIALLVLLMGGTIFAQTQALADDAPVAVEQISKVNINTANTEVLSELPGIGEKKAQAIVDYRKRNGEFTSVEELVNVRGIGEKMLEKIISKI